MTTETQMIIMFIIVLIGLVGLGYWSHRRYMLKKTGSTKIERGGVWGAIKFAIVLIIGIILAGYLLG